MSENFWRNTSLDSIEFLSNLKHRIKKNFHKFFTGLSEDYQIKIHKWITEEVKNNIKKDKLFDAIYFEIRSRCNSTCSFCAASIQNEIRPDITMPIDLFKKVINELSLLNYRGKIAFHVNNDPLLVKNLEEYVAYARSKCNDSWIQILTNGKSLNNKNGQMLIDAGVNEITINVYTKERKFNTPKNIKNFEKEVLLKKFAYNQIKEGHKNPKVEDKKTINYNKILRKVEDELTNRSGSAPNKKTNQKIPNLGFCSYPFEQFNIDAKGNVSHCCADFYFDNKMGNVKNQTITEIWSGKKFNFIRDNLLQDKRKNLPMCSKCDHFGINSLPKKYSKKMIYKLIRT